jgi:hypothetical protein
MNHNKFATLLVDVDNTRVCVYMGAESLWEIPISSPQLCCELNTALKIFFLKVIGKLKNEALVSLK